MENQKLMKFCCLLSSSLHFLIDIVSKEYGHISKNGARIYQKYVCEIYVWFCYALFYFVAL